DEADEEGWETESIYDDLLNEDKPYVYVPGPDVCSPEECAYYKAKLHQYGLEDFVRRTISTHVITAKKLCTAFGVNPPPYVYCCSDEAYYPLLGLAIARELNRRLKLPQYNTIEDAAELLRKAQNIIVITGAGISTSLGIPDFRSKNTGFYSRLRSMGFEEPEQVFDIHEFDENPRIFYSLAADILPDTPKWSPTHQFIRVLQDQGKLLRNYTQNIDNVEANAGILPEKLVQCHGSWATATCRKCGHKIPGTELFDDVKAKRVSRCKQCEQTLRAPRPGMKRKRSSTSNKARKWDDDDDDSDGAYDIPEPGVMKPDITFFGEQLPKDFFDKIRDVDKDKVDLVIVIGTSMKVAPVSEIPSFLRYDVPQIYISRDPIYHIDFDINLLGYSDDVVTELCRRARWDLKHEKVSNDQQFDVAVAEDSK
ncbi:SIR2-domain-containing protein, partial [Rhizodiscina lignyota]